MLPVDAEPVVRCKDCSNHGKCMFEDVFLTFGKSGGYCCVGGGNMSKWGDSIRESEDKSIVRVVYCEKCRYWHRYSSSSRKGRCNGLILYLNGELETPEDFFCADGEDR